MKTFATKIGATFLVASLVALLGLNVGHATTLTEVTTTPIRLATTTSTENSGLLTYLLHKFTADSGYKVHVIAVGTGKALRLGKDGDVDVVLVHAPGTEMDFVNNKYGVKRIRLCTTILSLSAILPIRQL